jgi:hypothetical protein
MEMEIEKEAEKRVADDLEKERAKNAIEEEKLEDQNKCIFHIFNCITK